MNTIGPGERRPPPLPHPFGGAEEEEEKGRENFRRLVPQLCVILPTSATFAWQLEILGLSAYKSVAISHLTT